MSNLNSQFPVTRKVTFDESACWIRREYINRYYDNLTRSSFLRLTHLWANSGVFNRRIYESGIFLFDSWNVYDLLRWANVKPTQT